jgi:uncharacterized protein DUF4231
MVDPATSPGGWSPELLERVISSLEGMDDHEKQWMEYRWLDQASWFDNRARWANRWHNILRVIAISGGVLVPGLVSIQSTSDLTIREWVSPAAFIVSLLVAAAVGLDGFFHFGDRWLQYRRTAELLKIEGWLFIEGAGDYKRHPRHAAFPDFAARVEGLIRHDLTLYLTEVVHEKPDALEGGTDQEEQPTTA